MYSDLKPENLLLESDKDDANLKVIDFGTSRQFDPNHKLSQRLGTVFLIDFFIFFSLIILLQKSLNENMMKNAIFGVVV